MNIERITTSLFLGLLTACQAVPDDSLAGVARDSDRLRRTAIRQGAVVGGLDAERARTLPPPELAALDGEPVDGEAASTWVVYECPNELRVSTGASEPADGTPGWESSGDLLAPVSERLVDHDADASIAVLYCASRNDDGAVVAEVKRQVEGAMACYEVADANAFLCAVREVEDPPSDCGDPNETAAIEAARSVRAEVGVAPFVCDPALAAVARAHSQEMCDQGFFSHTGEDGRGPFDRLRDAGVPFRLAGENLAQGQRTGAEVHQAWMDSPEHRQNIFNLAYGRVGVGRVECEGQTYWTQLFAD